MAKSNLAKRVNRARLTPYQVGFLANFQQVSSTANVEWLPAGTALFVAWYGNRATGTLETLAAKGYLEKRQGSAGPEYRAVPEPDGA